MVQHKFLPIIICFVVMLGIIGALDCKAFADDTVSNEAIAQNHQNDDSSFLEALDNPLDEDAMEYLKHTIRKEAKKRLVGRKAVEKYGPLGAGIQSITLDTYSPPGMANVDMLGIGEPKPVMTEKREVISIPEIYKDFFLLGRDIALSHGHHFGKHHDLNHYENHNHDHCDFPLDPSAAIVAALYCVAREDDIIFNGLKEFNRPGILNVEGRNTLKLSDWNKIGNGFENIANAIKTLAGQGFYGPYVAVVNPQLYANLQRVFEKTGELEIEGVEKLCKGGVYKTKALKNSKAKAVVISKGIQNMDLVIGQNLTVTYWGPEDLNHRFRIWESIALRIKNPKAICTIEP